MNQRNYYQETLERMEPDIAAVDLDAALPSIAISLKRIADSREAMLKETKGFMATATAERLSEVPIPRPAISNLILKINDTDHLQTEENGWSISMKIWEWRALRTFLARSI